MKQQENEETRLLKQKIAQLQSHRAGLEKIHSQRLRDLVESARLARQLQRENEEDTATEEAFLTRLKKQIAATQARLDTLLDQERATRAMLQHLYLDTPPPPQARRHPRPPDPRPATRAGDRQLADRHPADPGTAEATRHQQTEIAMDITSPTQQAHQWAAADTARRAVFIISAETLQADPGHERLAVAATCHGRAGRIIRAIAQVIRDNATIRHHVTRAVLLANQQEKQQQEQQEK